MALFLNEIWNEFWNEITVKSFLFTREEFDWLPSVGHIFFIEY